MRRTLLAAAVLIALAPEASACADADGVIEAVACLDAEYSRLDAELNRIWPEVLERFPSGFPSDRRGEHREAIRAAQRAWVVFRDAECEAVQHVGIARYWASNRLECLVSMTERRIETLTWTYLR